VTESPLQPADRAFLDAFIKPAADANVGRAADDATVKGVAADLVRELRRRAARGDEQAARVSDEMIVTEMTAYLRQIAAELWPASGGAISSPEQLAQLFAELDRRAQGPS